MFYNSIEKDVDFKNGLKDVEVNEKETAQFDCEPNKLESISGQAYPVVWYRRVEGGKEEKIEKSGRFEMNTKHKK